MRAKCIRLWTPGRARCALLWADCGTELFEFALVGLLLLSLLIGIFWLGRAYNVYESITRAAREGARYAVLPSCATCGNTYVDTYNSASCLTNPTNVFTNYVSPALSAASLQPSQVLNYCQKAMVLDPISDASVQQCGVEISFQYPAQLVLPGFTGITVTTVNIPTSVQMRMENQPINSSGTSTCP